jgi:hypothetical protein
MPPIRCTSGSSTTIIGTETPVDCLCQGRTHDIDCKTCANKDVCILLGGGETPHISAIHLSGSGPIDADVFLNKTCLSWGVSIVYTLPWTIDQPRIGKNGKIWSWIIVLQELPTFENEENIINNISSCMLGNGFVVESSSVYSSFKITSNVNHAVPCGLNYEWSGDSSGQQCTCIGGYEKASGVGGITWCSPCEIGTTRQTRSHLQCMLCQDNNSHAPWLGMDHCICKNGYFLDHVTNLCSFQKMGIEGYAIFSSLFFVIPISFTIGILCLLSTWMISMIT